MDPGIISDGIESSAKCDCHFQLDPSFSYRLYMGLAWSLQKGGPGDQMDKAVAYLKEGMELLLQRNSDEALSSK